jgi:hypothetical protein
LWIHTVFLLYICVWTFAETTVTVQCLSFEKGSEEILLSCHSCSQFSHVCLSRSFVF